MSSLVKILLGLAAMLLTGWVHHGPLGNGQAYVDNLERQARAAIAEVPGVEVGLGRSPLTRRATLAGPADSFQRDGMGGFPGIDARVAAIEGVSGIQWVDEGAPSAGMPLLLEKWLLIVIAYALGLGIGRLYFGRERRETYL